MADTTTTVESAASEAVTSRKRPAEEEPSAADADAGGASATDHRPDEENEEAPAKRARTEQEESSDEKKEEGEEEEKKEEEKPKLAFLPSVGDGFASFSSAAPLSFSSILGDASSSSSSLTFTAGSAPTFNLDFSSPTPFGSLFGSSDKSDPAPSLSSTGFSLFSSTASSSSSSSSSSDFSFSIGASSSLLFSQPSESSSGPTPEKVEVVTGEEDEKRVHSVRAKLLKLDQETQTWRERGSGQLHLNVANDGSYARLVMRAEGALRLILNSALFPHTIAKRVQEKSVQVSGVEEGKPALYLLRLGRRDEADDLFSAINQHKDTTKGKAAETNEP